MTLKCSSTKFYERTRDIKQTKTQKFKIKGGKRKEENFSYIKNKHN
jgi:hypothetical protein